MDAPQRRRARRACRRRGERTSVTRASDLGIRLAGDDMDRTLR
jgi:hypothetical protein